MKLLIIGGTGFLGRHLTALALDWGHEVTLFNQYRRQHPDWRELTQLQGTGIRPDPVASLSGKLGSGHRHLLLSPRTGGEPLGRPAWALRVVDLHLHHQRLSRLRPARQDESAPLHAIAEGRCQRITAHSRCCARPRIGPVGASGSAFCARVSCAAS